MNVDGSFLEQVMSSAVKGTGPGISKGEAAKPVKGEGGEESLFALRFKEIMKELFPEAAVEGLAEQEGLFGAFLSGEDGEFMISLKDMAFLKELLSAGDFSAFFADGAFKDFLPGLKELLPEIAEILAALEAEGSGMKEVVGFKEDELSSLYQFYFSPEDAAKALEDIRIKAEQSAFKGAKDLADQPALKEELARVLGESSEFKGESVKEFLSALSAGERGEVLLTEDEAKKLAALMAALKGEAAQKLAEEGLTFKEMLSADVKKLKEFLALLEKLSEKGEAAKELKAAKELIRDALVNAEKKEGLHQLRAGFLKEALYNVKAAEGRPAGATQSSVNNAALLELEESLGKKVSAVFASGESSMDSSGDGSKNQSLANSFMAFEPNKDAMLNLSRFTAGEIVDGKVYANAKGEFSNPQQVRAAVLDQITGRLNFFRETASLPAEMRMTLNPPSLGAVIVRVFMKQGKMAAEILTELSEVKEILDKSVNDLRQRLQNVNLVLERIDVYTADKDASGGNLFNRENKFAELAAEAAGKVGASAVIEGEPLGSEVAMWDVTGVHSLDIRV